MAEVAGVAKPTIYNHLNDKETLFRRTLAAVGDAVPAENLGVIERLRNPGDDLRATLENVAYRLIRSCCTEQSRSLRWLTYGQVAQFLDVMVGRTSDQLGEAIADRLARLSLSGRLRPSDPGTAAEQFLVLITGPMEGRTRLGARKVSTAEMRVVAAAAVDILLVRLWDAGGSLSFGITPKSITETHDAFVARQRKDRRNRGTRQSACHDRSGAGDLPNVLQILPDRRHPGERAVQRVLHPDALIEYRIMPGPPVFFHGRDEFTDHMSRVPTSQRALVAHVIGQATIE